jgi:two-component system sensor histidine kinase TtrS
VRFPVVAASLILAVSAPTWATDRFVSIGVLAYRGDAIARSTFSPTVEYLNERLPNHRFVIRPLTLEGMRQAIAREELDFVLTNPGHYVEFEAAHGLRAVLTLRRRHANTALQHFAATVFVRADRTDVRDLPDLRGRSFMAVNRDAFGGFQLAWRELRRDGIDPFHHFPKLAFNGFPQDAIVYAVRDRIVDAGVVRSGLLEELAQEGKIDLRDFHILHSRSAEGYPFLHSTPLYPEWPLARARHTPSELVREVAAALLALSADHPAARTGEVAGWTAPVDYKPVHDLFKELQVGPYARTGEPTLRDLITIYGNWVVTGAIVLLLLLGIMFYVLKLNRLLAAEIVERRRTEAELRKLSSALEQTADSVFISNRAGVVEYVNPAFERLTGYSRTDVLGRRINFLKSGVHDGAFYRQLWGALLRGDEVRETFVNRHKDGTRYYEEKTIAPLRNDRGIITHFVSTGRDVTARKQAEEQMLRQQEELARVTRLATLNALCSGIAHEINQPLTAIASYTQECVRRMRGNDGDRGALLGALEQVATQAQRAGDIIQQVRGFIAKRAPLRIPTDINGLAQQSLALMEQEIRQGGVSVSLDLAPDLPAVPVDGIQIQQVILNLLRNATQAMARVEAVERSLTVRTAACAGDEIAIAVCDTGPGLTAEQLERVFDPFFTTKPDGMGMGLTICRSIVEAHGGQLWAAPNADRGVTFQFTLPVGNGTYAN